MNDSSRPLFVVIARVLLALIFVRRASQVRRPRRHGRLHRKRRAAAADGPGLGRGPFELVAGLAW